MYIILLGAPGSGKGTQAEKLAKHLDIPHISTGEIMRGNPDPKIQAILSAGKLVSDEQMIEIVLNRLKTETNGWILDGFPRTIAQAEALKSYPAKVLYFKIDDQIVKKRLSLRRSCAKCKAIYHLESKPPVSDSLCDICGGPLIQRSDDLAEIVKERLEVYHEKTAPLVEHYRKDGSLLEIPSSGSPEETFSMITKLINVI